jgi:hypothetical protein
MRVFTLMAQEATQLPKFLTDEEDAALLRFFIFGEIRDLPDNLNPCLAKRCQSKDTEQILFTMSRCVIVSTERWYFSRPLNVQNELLITTNVDLYITKFTMVHHYFEHKDSESNKNKSVDINFRVDDSNVKIEVKNVTSLINTSTYEVTCSYPIFLSRNEPTRLTLTSRYSNGHYARVSHPVIDLASLGDTARKYFKQLQLKVEDRKSIFIKSFYHHLA